MTSSYGVTFQRASGLELMVYADTPYAPKVTKRKSVSGVAVMLGGAVTQRISRTQKCITLSSRKEEYVAMAEGYMEAFFVRYVWRFLLPDFGDPCIQVFEDNRGVIQMVVNPVSNSNSKHIDVLHHFLREHVENVVRIWHLSCRVEVSARRFLDETPCQGRLPFSQELH